jgi:hypothetical protein
MRILGMAAVGLAFSLMTSPGALSRGQTAAQQPYPGQGSVLSPPGRHPSPDSESMPSRIEEQQAQARNNERQKKLVADTDKLLALATDLKAQVDKTNKDTLSVDVIKKADEIEKLAHSVKERMKG